MRRIIFLTFSLLILAFGLGAQNVDSALYFKLLEAQEYHLDMFYSTELQRLYTQLDFDIPKSSLSADFHYGIFLDKYARFQFSSVAGSYFNNYRVNYLQPQYFVPELKQAGLLSAESPVIFYGIPINDLDKLPDIVHFRLWYEISMSPFKLDKLSKLNTSISSDLFWYPRNLTEKSIINLKLTTIPYLTLQVGNNIATKTDQDYKRTHQLSYIEDPEQPGSFYLIRD